MDAQAANRIRELEQQLLAERNINAQLQHRLNRLDNARASGSLPGSQDASQVNSDLSEQNRQLSKELSRLAAEKGDLENALEAEQEYIMHKLHKQLHQLQKDKHNLGLEKQQLKSTVQDLAKSVSRLSQEKVDLEQSLEMEEEAFINSLMRQVAGVMQNYKAMEKAMHQHGIKITQIKPESPQMCRRRGASAAASQDGNTLTPGARRPSLARQSASSASNPHRHSGPREVLAAASSPGATLHATRERLEAMVLQPAASGAEGKGHRARRLVPREDSLSSMASSTMSAMSRDVSVSRESAGGMPWHPTTYPMSNASDSCRSHH